MEKIKFDKRIELTAYITGTIIFVFIVIGIIGSYKYPMNESIKLKVSEIKYNNHEYIIFKTTKYGSSKEIIHSPDCEYCNKSL